VTPVPTVALNDGHALPAIGLGTYAMVGERGIRSLLSGLQAGYRLLDTALKYGNEAEVGEAVRRSPVPREEIVVTTKLAGRHHGYDQTLAGFAVSMANLGLEQLDLYLIHWPLPRLDRYVDSWRAMIRLRDEGRVRSIGVSNFGAEHLDRPITETGVTPAVNQVELHPAFPQAPLRAVDAARGIVTQSWSPLAEGRSFAGNGVVTRIARAHGVTAAQVVLRWNVQLGAVPVPRSADPGRQRENLDVFGFVLSDAEMAAIDGLATGRRLWGADPLTYESL
jgi:diketogulonate reductase-like aldo/keto reductase